MNWFTRGVRNAFRNVTRTFALVIILGLSIGLAVSMLIAHQAVSQKINNVKGSVDNTVSVFPAGIRGFAGGGNPLTESQLQPIAKLSHVTSIVQTLSDRMTSSDTNLQSSIGAGALGRRFARQGGFGGGFSGQFRPSGFTLPVPVNGTNSPTNLSASKATSGGGTFNLVSGTVFNGSSNANVALVGSALATKNNLKVGSTFTAYNTTITVVGIFSSGNSFGDNQVVMPLLTLQRITGETSDVTNAIVYVDSVTNVNSVTTAIKNLLGSSADVTNSIQQAQSTVSSLDSIQTVSLYSLIGSVIAGSVIILLTMVMIVRERRREIGVIKAIGSSNLRIAAQFMSEAVTLTLVAAVIGVIVGALASNPITSMLVSSSSNKTANGFRPGSGIKPRHFGGTFGGFRHAASTIHTAVGFNIIGYGLAAALIIAIVGSSIAAYVISRIRPAEVMRVE